MAKILNGEGGINGLAKISKVNKQGGWNKWRGKNIVIRNFIDLKSSNDLVKISTKRT